MLDQDVLDNNNNNSYLTCPICFEQLKGPLRASCNHVFCKKCLLDWMRPGNRTCPLCRQEMERLMVDTVEDMVQEGHIDFAIRPTISDVIMKRSATRRPKVFHQNEFDDLLMEEHWRIIRKSMIMYRKLVQFYKYLDDVCGPPFGFGYFILLALTFLLLFWIVDESTGAGRNIPAISSDETGWFVGLYPGPQSSGAGM